MKFWKAAMAVILLAGLTIIPLGCDDDLSNAASDTGVDLRGRWQLTTAWSTGNSSSTGPLFVELDGEALGGTLSVSRGETGEWSYDSGVYTMVLSVDVHTVYSGRLVDGSNRIEGNIRNNQNNTATFVMTR